MPDDSPEIERIRAAYARYAREPAEQRRRDPGNAGLQALVEEWHTRLARRLAERQLPAPSTRVLDVGCGGGALLAWLVQCGADPARVVGLDLMPERLALAARRLPDARFVTADAAAIPAPDGAFDLITMSMVVSSAEPRLGERICGEVARVLSPEGVVAWYDIRSPNPMNQDVRAVRRREVERLFPGFGVELESISLLPPLARALPERWVPRAYPRLAALRPLRGRYLGLLTRES
jgi:ubiquinone/menaquinone biosynthesis C-methylase UbiE